MAQPDETNVRDWRFTASKKPILTTKEANAAESRLSLALPEICFGNNSLHVQHLSKAVSLRWDALEALSHVDNTGVEEGTGNLKVAHAKLWETKRQQAEAQGALGERPLFSVVNNYDWTYTSTYAGAVESDSQFQPAPSDHPGIPMARLADTSEPILYFNQVTLYEDELHDNGLCDLIVRIRVMPYGYFILSRFFLRVDKVLFRIFDTRVYHAFGSNEIIRETKGRQAPYERIKAMLPTDKNDDLSPLTDSSWVGQALGMLSDAPQGEAFGDAQIDAWKGLDSKREVLSI